MAGTCRTTRGWLEELLPCCTRRRITLLRLKPYMFEPNDDDQGGLRVKQPLASFLAKFKGVRVRSKISRLMHVAAASVLACCAAAYQ